MRPIDDLPAWDEAPHRSVALRHAAAHGRPGLWLGGSGSSVVWLREGDDGRWEAFGSGEAGPALGWIAARAGGRPVALMAPDSWEAAIRARGERVNRAEVITWVRPGPAVFRAPVAARRLEPGDDRAFGAVAPAWALRSWGDFATMIERGAGFGVPTAGGLAAIAWIYESDGASEKLGVATDARFRRLGLGRSAASALVDHVRDVRGHRPLWTTHAGNAASVALARRLGFADRVVEALRTWTPRP